MTNDAAQIRVIDDFLAPESHEQMARYLRGPGWAFGSYSDAAGARYWYKHFAGLVRSAAEGMDRTKVESELAQFGPVAGMWQAIRNNLLPNYELVRSYANGYPYGADGGVHLDADVPEHITALYYGHHKWEPNWGGETVFFDRGQRDIVATSYARPNRLILFPGDLPHAARGISRSCPELRITLMFKARP